MKRERRSSLWLLCASFILTGSLAAWAQSRPDVATPPKESDPLDEIKQPTDWLNWGADLRLRHEHLWNHFTLNDNAPDREWGYERYRARLWGDAVFVRDDATKQPMVDANVRFTWEGRHWWLPDSKEEWDWSDIVWDNLYLRVTNPCQWPVRFTVGRQDIGLGDTYLAPGPYSSLGGFGWLVFEGTPLDGSRTTYFDAARVDIGLKQCKTDVSLIFINQDHQPTWLPSIFNDDPPISEQNERGGILWVTNKSLDNTELDGWFIYKHDDARLINGDSGDIYTPGFQVAHKIDDHWGFRVAGAYQFGDKNSANLSAWAFNSRLAYSFNDSWKNQLRLSFEGLSGDDPDTATNEQFDVLWSRWPQWSELLVYTWATETRIAEVTNFVRVALGWTVQPLENTPLQFSAEYSLLFDVENSLRGVPGYSNGGDFRGQLFQAVLQYQFNKHIRGHLWGEYFIPGNYYSDDRQDAAIFLRAQLELIL